MSNEIPNVSAIANWFGSARMVAHRIGPELAGCSLVVVPFAAILARGGKLFYIARNGVVAANDEERNSLRDIFEGEHAIRQIAFIQNDSTPQAAAAKVLEGMGSKCGRCWKCLDGKGLVTHMIVCRTCGNKRCPHASDCSLECTGSNDVGQKGSVYA